MTGGRAYFIPDEPEQFCRHVQFKDFYSGPDDTYYMIFKVLDANVSQELWAKSLLKVRSFLKWIRRQDLRFHFVFDIHECEVIPTMQLFELQQLLKKKDAILKAHLHSSVVITSNRVVELVLRSAFNLVHPVRPLSILLACDFEDDGRDESGIPSKLWEECVVFFADPKNRLV